MNRSDLEQPDDHRGRIALPERGKDPVDGGVVGFEAGSDAASTASNAPKPGS